ncbi:hypothetical protein KFE25_009801 [Diacronema lutheri]|uniref:ABC transporter domain-containing protein n=1 Tax=Diacronema lutheri TaxID=2081491 RepID=A0A8J6BZQ6_DIALT|nr:hypothetical protein KFE25_009801 [Diacronema lutheri]
MATERRRQLWTLAALTLTALAAGSSRTGGARPTLSVVRRADAPARFRAVQSSNAARGGAPAAAAPAATGARLLWADKLSRANDGKVFQFEQISAQLVAGQRLGLVGPNGCGKSTLLRVLAGVERADAGAVETSRGARILYVEQEPPLRGSTIREAVYCGIEPDTTSAADTALRAAYAYHVAALRAEADSAAFEAAAAAAADCWDDDARARAICEVLGLSGIMDKDVAVCSGGERKRAGLAAALARQPDALLLDEPTNHLDGRAVEWLADLLTTAASNREAPAVLCVSHDRFFLERVCSSGLLELDRGALHTYDWRSSYETYLALKDERLSAERGVAERARTVLRREREWMAKQPRARQAKSVARQGRYFELEAAAAAGGPAAGAQLGGLRGMTRLGSKVLELRAATLAPPGDAAAPDRAPPPLVKDFTFELAPRSRWGVVGPNGVGKTSLLRAIAGELALQAGERIVGPTVSFGYYDQRGLDGVADTSAAAAAAAAAAAGEGASVVASSVSTLSGSATDPLAMRVLAFVTRCVDDARGVRGALASAGGGDAPSPFDAAGGSAGGDGTGGGGGAEAAARRLLNLLAFPQDKWGALVGRLSGGERRRLQLLAVLARAPNVLILDEPTNDLDLPTIGALEQFLHESFGGVLLCVSHDRAFVERTCTDGVLAFMGDGRVVPMEGGYSAYLDALKEAEGAARREAEADRRAKADAAAAAVASAAIADRPTAKAVKLSFKESREWETIEADVNALRAELAAAERAFAKACAGTDGTDHVLVAELSAQVDALLSRVEAKEERWLELMERVQSVPA